MDAATKEEVEDLQGAARLKCELVKLKRQISGAAVCSVCWMPVPSCYALPYTPEKWYFDQLGRKCAYCGKSCLIPAPDSKDADHNARALTSLKARVRTELMLAGARFGGRGNKKQFGGRGKKAKSAKGKSEVQKVTISQHNLKKFKRQIPPPMHRGQGKGIRQGSKTVPAGVLVGCLRRTYDRIAVEPQLAQFKNPLVNALRYLGAL